MSSSYNVEPQPTAKVLLHTTSGDISLSLFAAQTPLASRNFIQHILDGYYDNTVFHRLIPSFILQGGDPTSLGTGGQSSFPDGAPFADEFYPRLRFNRRGLLGMANAGSKNDNGSQFFLTLGPTPELDGKHTMFGRVEGDTIYNLVRAGEGEVVEGTDRPVYPVRITGAEVLVNPFEGMVARRKEVEVAGDKEQRGKKRKVGKAKAKVGLSFGEEGEEDADVGAKVKKAKVNPNFGAAPASADKEIRPKPAAQVPVRRRSPTPRSSRSVSPAPAAPMNGTKGGIEEAARRAPLSEDALEEPEQIQKTVSALDRTNAQIAALKQSMKRNAVAPQQTKEKPVSALEAMIPTTSTRGRKRGKNRGEDDNGGLSVFNAFRKKLDSTGPTKDVPDVDDHALQHGKVATGKVELNGSDAVDEEEKTCDLHFIVNCQSCSAWADQDQENSKADDDDDPNWMSHKLSFAKDLLGKDLEWKRKMEEFEVIDPREKERDILGAKKREKDKRDGKREGDRGYSGRDQERRRDRR